MNRRGDAGGSGIDCWDRKKRGGDYCDGGKEIVTFHCKLPILQDCDGSFCHGSGSSSWVELRKLRCEWFP